MNKNKHIPKLRFPEFRNSCEWGKKELGKSAKFSQGIQVDLELQSLSLTEERIKFLRIENYTQKSQDFRYISTKFASKTVNDKNIVVVRYGASAGFVSRGFSGVIANNLFTISPDKKMLSEDFLYIILKSDSAWNYFQSRMIGGAMPALSFKLIERLPVPIPPTLEEQEKIAECLSSVDELITAQADKVAALKEHKKGLMEKLFPQEGKTIPSYRFPEFHNAPPWQEKLLHKLGRLVSGLTYKPEDVRDDGLLVLRSSNVQNNKLDLYDSVYVRSDMKGANLVHKDDILICVRNGSKDLIGKNALIPNKMPLCTHGAFMTIFRANQPQFVFQLFQTKDYESQVNADLGATINSINSKNLLKYKFCVPNENEQKKIAECLSSLDELISLHTEKLSALKEHKKGLMQQLFPVVEEE